MKSKTLAVLFFIISLLTFSSCSTDDEVVELYFIEITQFSSSGTSGTSLGIVENYLKTRGCVEGLLTDCKSRDEALKIYQANVAKIVEQELSKLLTEKVSFSYSLSTTNTDSQTTILSEKKYSFDNQK